MPWPNEGDIVPLVTVPTTGRRVHHVVPLARNAPVVHDQSPQPLRRAVGLVGLQGVGVHEVLGELRDPAQSSSHGEVVSSMSLP